MADITYRASQDSPQNIPGFEQYQDSDKNLVTSYQVNSIFDSNKNFAELHILDLADTLLQSDYDYTQYTLLANAQSAGKEGASVLTIDPIQDALSYGFAFGGVKVLYHFLNDLYTSDKTSLDFYIDSISPDRTELRLLTQKLTPEQIVSYTNSVKSRLQDQSDFSEFRLNFKNNSILIAINIDTLDSVNGKAVVVKLYEPLPAEISKKATLSIVESISDSVAYELDYEVAETVPASLALRSPNFNLDLQEYNIVPTEYFNYDELLSYKVNNANSEIYSMINEKGVDLSINYSDYSNFIHFSSAQERLLNFKYKVDLLTQYSQSLNTVKGVTGGPQGVSGSVIYYENLYKGIVDNFDHYERFLYYESGSLSWPKSNSTKPYINLPSKDPVTNIAVPEVTAWFNEALTNSVAYDASNYNILTQTIPTYISDDDNNQNYLTFIYMIGQHFDNLWIYGKAVTDKYDADNRLNHGISKDLVGEALKNFGVKLYTSNKSTEDLFSALIGQAYQSGSEVINNYITGSLTGSNTPIQPASYDGYQKEVQKRIYHNLPLLLKSKGTERGLRALINCFGIPSDILKIKLYGGRNIDNLPFFGDYQYYTSSLDKIRTDHTGSITPGDTLSQYTSIVHRDYKYTDDLHAIEVGFSPTDNIDNYIISQSVSTFNIDNYIGDPRDLTSNSYSGLSKVAESILGNLDQYNLQDYVRLIKFFDNVIFKMVKDFIPARAIADTGIIIKPNLLNRSKAKSVGVSGSRSELEYFTTIDTAFISASDGGVYKNSQTLTTRYVDSVQTPVGIGTRYYHNQEEAKYNGELSGSHIIVTNGNLTRNNPYLTLNYPEINYNINLYKEPPAGSCTLGFGPLKSVTPGAVENLATFFTSTNQNTIYTTGSNPLPITNPATFKFPNLEQYGKVIVIAKDPNSNSDCEKSREITVATCYLEDFDIVTKFIDPAILSEEIDHINLLDWQGATYTSGIEVYVNGILVPRYSPPPNLDIYSGWDETVEYYRFKGEIGDKFTVTYKDTRNPVCTSTVRVTIGQLPQVGEEIDGDWLVYYVMQPEDIASVETANGIINTGYESGYHTVLAAPKIIDVRNREWMIPNARSTAYSTNNKTAAQIYFSDQFEPWNFRYQGPQGSGKELWQEDYRYDDPSSTNPFDFSRYTNNPSLPRTQPGIGYGIQNTKIITDAFPNNKYLYAAGAVTGFGKGLLYEDSWRMQSYNSETKEYEVNFDVFLPSLEELKKFAEAYVNNNFQIVEGDPTRLSTWSSTQDDSGQSYPGYYESNQFFDSTRQDGNTTTILNTNQFARARSIALAGLTKGNEELANSSNPGINYKELFKNIIPTRRIQIKNLI